MTKKTSTLAIMFADIAQSTKLYDQIGNAAAYSLISSCIAVMADVCIAHNGTVVKTIGDEIMCTFTTAKDAVDAAKTMQAAVDNIPDSDLAGYYSPDIYVGIDFGPVIEENSDVFGDSVNVAARMVKLAKRRQIIVTQQVIDALPVEYSEGCRIVDNVLLKGKSEGATVFEIIWEKEMMTMAINISGEGKSQIKQRMELRFAENNFEVSDSRPTITIGRLDHNDIVVDDSRVSRFHARIEYRKGKYFVIDQSTNGTYITEENSATVLLQRDEMQLGINGIIDLCIETPSVLSKTAIIYSSQYYKTTEPEAAEPSNTEETPAK
ncbi:MAG: FHA domain-containing protein [Candidatus Riflebacteria bacterium]|nr:FHA domain-containing protein [Candidatus Riflebacteria bacterium]